MHHNNRDAVVARAERADRVGWRALPQGRVRWLARWGVGQGGVAGRVRWQAWQGRVAGLVVRGGWISGVKNVLV